MNSYLISLSSCSLRTIPRPLRAMADEALREFGLALESAP